MAKLSLNPSKCGRCGHKNRLFAGKCEQCGQPMVLKRNLLIGSMVILVGVPGVAGAMFVAQKMDKGGRTLTTLRATQEIAPSTVPVKQVQQRPAKSTSGQEGSLPLPQVGTSSTEPELVSDSESIENDQVGISKESDSYLISLRAESPQLYRDITRDASMLTSNLPLRISSGRVNDISIKEFDMLALELRKPENQNKQVYIFGFSGNVGSEFIAKKRVNFAKEIMIKKYKIKQNIFTHGFGPYFSNTSGRGDNRKIEVWIK
ncbi:MAG: hypothetical protein AAGI38_22755 [Bacteroidota bacterium]